MKFYDVNDLAELLGVLVSTVRLWIRQGKGPDTHRIGRHIRVSEADLQAWLTKTRVEAQTH